MPGNVDPSRRIRALLVAEDIRAMTGGVPAVVKDLSAHLTRVGVDVQVAYALGQGSELPLGVGDIRMPPDPIGRAWAWSSKQTTIIDKAFAENRNGRRVLHIHGIWAAPQCLAARCALRAKVPFILSPHGMLEPWLWTEQGRLKQLKKSVYWRLIAYPAFRQASVIHAITQLERDNLRELFPENRIEIIPNAVDTAFTTSPAAVSPGKRIAFLGRIDPKKAVDILIEAFACAGLDAEWQLDIAGPSWSSLYTGKLQTLVKRLGLEQRVKFLGPLFGADKVRFLQSAWMLATPSYSEAIGLVNLEAAVLGTPAITTPQTGLLDWEQGGGLLVEPQVEAFAEGIRAAASWDIEERRRRGNASRVLVERRYGWEAVLPSWVRLYESLVN